MVQVFQALAATFNRRWFRRLIHGVPSLAFEVHILPQRDRPARVVLTVVCAPEDVLRVDGCLQAAYPDVRVGYEFSQHIERAADAPTWTDHVKRLKKRRAFITRVAAADLEGVGSQPFDHQMIDGLLANLAHITAPVTVQLSLTPAPRWVDRLAQYAYREEERRLAAGQLSGELGERSPRATADLRGGLTVQYHLLFYFDIRCASSDPETALLAANSLSQGVGENKLTLKEPFLLHALYAKRIEKAIPRLIPPIRHGVLSSGELAALWQLPTNRVKSVMIKRSNQLREPASPAIWRPKNPEDAFAEDEHGPIGIRPADRKFGVALTGVPGVGKTSAMVGLWKCDARDRDAVLIGLDPKTEAAEEMLAQVPPDRTVYWLDLARPEFGMNPLMMRASMEVIGDTVVESLRDINEEGAIMAASDRYLRSATYGALLLARSQQKMPSWFDLYMQLWSEDTGAELRRQVWELCQDDADLAGLRALWGTILPNMLKESRSQVVVRMDAPGNKLARLLGQPTLTRMLHHPKQVSIDQIVDERAVLIVQGSMGTLGEENTVIMLKLLLRMVHTVLQRQQQKPSHERVRLCLYLDEVHYLWSTVLETMLSTGRAARLEPTLAWQHSGQIEEQRMAKGVLADLQTVINGRCGDSEEAEMITRRAMVAYTTRLSGEQRDRDNARYTPDLMLKLDHHYMLMQAIVGGQKDKPAIIRTQSMRKDIARIEHHLRRQHERGYFYPEEMPDPLPNTKTTSDDGAVPAATSTPEPDREKIAPDCDTVTQRALPAPSTSAPPAESTSPSQPPQPPPRAPVSPARRPPAPARHQPQTRGAQDSEPQPPALPGSYTELELGDVRQIVWDRPQVLAPPPGQQPKWKPDEVRALTMLHRFGPLMTTQIGRVIWPDRTERTVQRRMEALHKHGLVNRLRMATNIRHPFIYTLTEEGFRIAKDGPNEDGRHYLDPTVKFSAPNDEIPDPKPADTKWRESELRSGLYVLSNLHAAGWALTACALLGDAAKRVHGGRESSCAIRPPRGTETREDVAMQGNRSVGDLQLERFKAIWADARLDVHVQGHHMTHWYVECDRAGRPSKNSRRKFAAYDAMFNGWGQMLNGYQQRLPIVVFVYPEERSVLAHLLAADHEMTGWVAGLVGKLEDRVYVGRQRTWFAWERDVHQGSLRAWRLPDLPPRARKALGYPEKLRPVIKELVAAERLRSNPIRRAEPGRRRSAA